MTTVRVTVTTATKGDVEIEVQDQAYYPDSEGTVIALLLDDAVAKVRRAFEI